MHSPACIMIFLIIIVASCHALLNEDFKLEARGKKKKIALFVYFADLVVKKIFILKLIYAFVFWVVLHKAGYFLGWFASYLKEKKQEFHHDDHHHYAEPSYGTYGPSIDTYGPPHGPSFDSYGPSYGPYKRQTRQ